MTDYISKQFARPYGPMAPAMAVLLNAVNKKVNRVTVDAAGLDDGDTVMDVGFGGGVGVGIALARVGADGRVVAVDPSPELVARAKRRFREPMEAGRLTLRVGEAAHLGTETASVDALYTVNTVYFWPDVEAGFHEISRVLKPDGRAVIAVQPSVIARHERFSGLEIPSPEDLVAIALRTGLGHGEVAEPARDVVLVVLKP